jgi:hypothetical protein
MLGQRSHSGRYDDTPPCALVAGSLAHSGLPLIFPVARHG